MSNDREIAADQSSPPIDQTQIDKILTSVWETAARLNPMLLATLRPDYEFERLLEMIRDCLAKGLSAADATAHTLREFLRSAGTNNQPHNKCDGPGLPPPNQRAIPVMRRRRQENDFNLSLRYITEAEARVSRQEQLIVQLKKNGEPTGQAEGALKEYEGSLLQLRNHLVIMQVLMKPD